MSRGEEATGSWSLDGVNLSANAVEDYLSDDLRLRHEWFMGPSVSSHASWNLHLGL